MQIFCVPLYEFHLAALAETPRLERRAARVTLKESNFNASKPNHTLVQPLESQALSQPPVHSATKKQLPTSDRDTPQSCFAYYTPLILWL